MMMEEEEPALLRARAVAAATLAAKSQDAQVAKVLLQVSEEFEEEACKLEAKRAAQSSHVEPLD